MAAILAPVFGAVSCGTVDADQSRICRIAVVALEPPGSRVAVRRVRPAEGGVSLEYGATGPDGVEGPHAATCRFALGRREDLVGVVRDGHDVPGATVYLLNRYFVDTPEGRAVDLGAPP